MSERIPVALRERDPHDPVWKAVELAQRGRMILDVSRADLEAAESRLGPFHETTWFFRNALAEARRSWDHLRAQFGTAALEAALEEPPLAVLELGSGAPRGPRATLVLIASKTYRAQHVSGTELAPIQWRLTCLHSQEHGPYYACRLKDGTIQCDCADWIYQTDDSKPPDPCKHLAALMSLGWL